MLTDTKARAAKAHPKPYKLADEQGLYLYIAPSGAKSWRYDYRVAGARATLTIGKYPDVTLADARQEHMKARRMVAQGLSPSKQKQREKEAAQLARENTVRAACETWYEDRALARSASWCSNARRWLEKDIYPEVGGKPAKDVSIEDVERLVRNVAKKRGPKSAHYVRQALSSVFRSLPRSLGIGNPARDAGNVVELPPTSTPKGRPLSAKEIPPFFDAVDRYPGRLPTKLAIRLLMLTFVRKSELTEALWEEINFDRAEWVISAERMKMSKPHIVPLSQQALECFQKLHPLACGSTFVFPNHGNPKKPMSASTLNMVFDRIGYGQGRFTPHGARATASTALNDQGWPGDAIERQLAHTERDEVRAAYNHADFLGERRRMMQHWADYIDDLCSGADVVSIKKHAA